MCSLCVLIYQVFQQNISTCKPKIFYYSTYSDFVLLVQEDDFVARDDFEDADQLRIGNDGIFMLTFFSKILFSISAVVLKKNLLHMPIHASITAGLMRHI